MSKEKAKEYINNSIEILNSMNWLINTQRTEAIMYLDKALKELEDRRSRKEYRKMARNLQTFYR